MTHTRRSILAGVGAAVLASTFTPLPAFAADPIVIGVFGPMTGERSALGLRFREAVEMFIDEKNSAGGIDGRPLEALIEDSRGVPREAANIAQKFADNPDVMVVIGGQTSTESMAAGPILAEAHIPQIAPTAGHPDYVKISPYQFRTTPTHPSMVEPHVKMLVDRMGMKKIAIVYFKDDWGLITNEMVSKRLKEMGIDVVLSEAMIPETRDFRPLITKIKSSGADGVFLASHYAESALFMQQLRQADPDLKVAATDTLNDPKFIELAGPAAEGVVMPTPFQPLAPAAKAFTAAYEKRFGKLPNYYSAFTYDAMLIATKAMEALVAKGEPITREALRDQIADGPAIEGVSGTLKYQGSGDLGPREVNYLIVKDGAYAPY